MLEKAISREQAAELSLHLLVPKPGRTSWWKIEIQITHYLRKLSSFNPQVVIAFTIIIKG